MGRIIRIILFLSFIVIMITTLTVIYIYDKNYKEEISIRRNVDAKKRRKILLDIYSIITNVSYNTQTKPFLLYGTLLGYVREKDIICYDFDLDFGIDIQEFNIFQSALSNIINQAYRIERKYLWGFSSCKIIHIETGISADIFPFIQKGNNVRRNVPRLYSTLYLKECRATYPIEWIYPLKQVQFAGRNTWIPNNEVSLLKCYYGDMFMTPDHICDKSCNVCVKNRNA